MTYRYTNAKLCEFLCITRDEMIELKTIISKDEKTDRRSTRNRESYLTRLRDKGICTKDEAIYKRRKDIYIFIMDGKTNAVICSALSISRSTFYMDKQAIFALNKAQRKELLKAEIIGFTSDAQDSPKNSALILREGYVVPVTRTVSKNIPAQSAFTWGDGFAGFQGDCYLRGS